MRLLLVESLPRGLKTLLESHDVTTVQEQGWSGSSNGDLLRLAEDHFDVFITADQNLEYQQNLAGYRLGVVLLAARTTRMPDLTPLIPELLEILDQMTEGEVRRIALASPS